MTKKRSALEQTQEKLSKPSHACLEICLHKLLAHGGEGHVLEGHAAVSLIVLLPTGEVRPRSLKL
jgi:hypothetical protein